jgi:NitT/TauT family transport system permease protein
MNFLRNTFMTVYKNRLDPNYWDIFAFIFTFSLIFLFAWSAKQMTVPYQIGTVTSISLDPHYLPFYALRTVSRMLIAMLLSLLFTLTVATWAAKSRRAERFIIPMIDILQSVPILGFLSITVVGFIKLFPGSLLGPECAAIFVIFTSQAWNMALGFYQTVRTVPADLQEVARMFHLSAWQRFWRIEVSYSLPGLLWNMMVSMSAGWFFVVASEAISVANQHILLPGIGSYIAVAIKQANLKAICYAILAMFVVILLYDQILFRPLVAWAEKFKAENIASEREIRSWLMNMVQRTRVLRFWGGKIKVLWDAFVNISWPSISVPYTLSFKRSDSQRRRNWFFIYLEDILFWLVVLVVVLVAGHRLAQHLSWEELGRIFMLGFFTALRVFILVFLCSLIWVPIGVYIGLRPHIAHIIQPLAQFLAAFPANLFYPLVVMSVVLYHINPEIGLTPLMILGAQWYILFNVIAGASMLPKDFLDVANNFGMGTWLRWRRVILPAIFPYYITGAITAAGGSWNASIVAEVVHWGDTTIKIPGLGAYISAQATLGNFTQTALAIGVMSLFVVVINRLFWRPLYVLAINRFVLD